jgi:hypothetical protein
MRRGITIALLVVLLVSGRGLVESVAHDYAADVRGISSQAEAHYRWVRAQLAASFEGYGRRQVFAGSFQIVALSNLASGLLNLATLDPARRSELAPLAAELVRRALHPRVSPYGRSPEHVTLDDHNLYLSHLDLVLGAYRVLSGDSHYDALHDRVTRHLVARTLVDGDFHARSYPGSGKWTADQTVTLAAIALYDLGHGTILAPPLVDGFRRMMRAHVDRATDLYVSSISAGATSKIPRGCAVSWSTYYLMQFAPDLAAAQYAAYRRAFARDVLGLGGFREWPADRARGMDVDSGPIVFGVGMAATGFGLGAARVVGDAGTYATIARTAAVFGLPIGLGTRSSLLAPMLGEAILFNGETAVRWRGAPSGVAPSRAPRPLGAALIFVAWLAVVVRVARGSARGDRTGQRRGVARAVEVADE